jgi:hypothetical protein
MNLEEITKRAMDEAAISAVITSSIPSQQQVPQFGAWTLIPIGQTCFDQLTTVALLTNRDAKVRLGGLEKEFKELAAKWKSDRGATSSSTALSMHPAYQLIIGMGERVLPLIFADLQQKPDHWFWALRAITHENPVPPESRGKIQEMANAWLAWGREKGYVR